MLQEEMERTIYWFLCIDYFVSVFLRLYCFLSLGNFQLQFLFLEDRIQYGLTVFTLYNFVPYATHLG